MGEIRTKYRGWLSGDRAPLSPLRTRSRGAALPAEEGGRGQGCAGLGGTFCGGSPDTRWVAPGRRQRGELAEPRRDREPVPNAQAVRLSRPLAATWGPPRPLSREARSHRSPSATAKILALPLTGRLPKPGCRSVCLSVRLGAAGPAESPSRASLSLSLWGGGVRSGRPSPPSLPEGLCSETLCSPLPPPPRPKTVGLLQPPRHAAWEELGFPGLPGARPARTNGAQPHRSGSGSEELGADLFISPRRSRCSRQGGGRCQPSPAGPQRPGSGRSRGPWTPLGAGCRARPRPAERTPLRAGL